jgi:L-ectoine synthase
MSGLARSHTRVMHMIVRTLRQIIGSDRDIDWGNGRSRRFLLQSDGLGFAVCDTVVLAGSESRLEYKNHLEACYCIEGTGELEDDNGNRWQLAPGVLYALNQHDKHLLRAKTDLRLICVFNPALTGNERHALSGQGSSGY